MSELLFKTIKERLRIDDYVGAQEGGFIACPNSCSSRRTCQVYDDHIHCHKCGLREDVFDVLQRTKNVDKRGALRLAAAAAGVPMEANKERTELLIRCQKELQRELFLHQPDKLEALMSWRGWSRTVIARLGIGYCDPEGKALERTGLTQRQLIDLGYYDDRFCRDGEAPWYRFADRYTFNIRNLKGELVSMKGRLAQGYTEVEVDKLKKSLPLPKDGPWGPHSHMDHLFLEELLREYKDKPEGSRYVVITEGEPNATSLLDKNFPVLGLMTNKGLAKFAHLLTGFDRIYVCLDNDTETLKTLMSELYALQMALPRTQIYLVTLPYLNGPDVKLDVDEFFHKHGKTGKDFAALCKAAPEAPKVLIERHGKKPPYDLLYALIDRLSHRRDELVSHLAAVSGRSRELIEFAIDTTDLTGTKRKAA